MKTLNIFLGNDVFEEITGDILAVDSFALALLDHGYKDFIAIGDFDSCSSEEKTFLDSQIQTITHPCEKDDGDFELALKYAIENNYSDVVAYNIKCGNRVDHFINNIAILKKYNKKLNIVVKDRSNYMYFLKEENNIEKSNFEYISLVILEDVTDLEISSDFKYPFKGNVERFDTRFISNSLVNELGKITYTSGEILLIMSKD